MGSGIAQVAAQSGCYTLLFDINAAMLEKAKAGIQKNLQYLVDKEKITVEEKENIYRRIKFVTDTNDCIADVFIEAIVEKVEAKTAIFNQLAEINHSEVIFATNTSSLSVSDIQAQVIHPERVVGMHFFNPVPLMKLVEVVKGNQTSHAVAETIMQLCKQLNKVPSVVNDYPGFIANKVLMPMINEAIYSLYEGIADVESIDTIMKLGMAHPMGPLQLADFIGLDVCLSIMNVLYKGYGNPKYAPCPLLVNMVTAKKLGVKSGEGFYVYTPGSKELLVSPRFL